MYNNKIIDNKIKKINITYIDETDLLGARFHGHELTKHLRNKGLNDVYEIVWRKESELEFVEELASNIVDRKYINECLLSLENYFDTHATLLPFSFSLLYNLRFLNADIVHYHIIHNNFFNIKDLPILTKLKPTVWTLHDPWAVTGHCVHFFECNNWQTGCGHCPKLNTHFPIKYDTTRLNWEIKKVYYAAANFDIIVASKWMQNIVQSSPLFVNKKVHLIPFGLDLTKFTILNNIDLRNKYNIPLNHFVIGLRSSSQVIKGLSFVKLLLKALSNKQDITIVTLDEANLLDEYKPNFQIIDFGLILNEAIIIEFYNLANIFLMPSTVESFGMSAMEAIACGTPVIAFDNTALSEVICAPLGGVIIKQNNLNDFLLAVLRFIDDKEYLHAISASSRLLAQQKFDIERYMHDILTIYNEVIAKFDDQSTNEVVIQQLSVINDKMTSKVNGSYQCMQTITQYGYLHTKIAQLKRRLKSISIINFIYFKVIKRIILIIKKIIINMKIFINGLK